MSERNTPEVNAGSMADIAFLLLIFFLVTTTMDTDLGIYKKLPVKQIPPPIIDINENNILEINLNANNEILIEGDQPIVIGQLKQFVIDFIDNGAGTNNNGEKCTWCNGKKDMTSSDHPEKAVISFQSKRNTSYATYIAAQNEILSAYSFLRNQLAMSHFNKSYDQLEIDFKKNKSNITLAKNIEFIKSKYPQLIAEQIPEK